VLYCAALLCLLLQGQQRPLAAGDVMQFGASTRTYTLQLGQPAAAAAAAGATAGAAEAEADGNAAAAPKKKKRARVKFADDEEDDNTAAAAAAAAAANGAVAAEHSSQGAKRNKLEQVCLQLNCEGRQQGCTTACESVTAPTAPSLRPSIKRSKDCSCSQSLTPCLSPAGPIIIAIHSQQPPGN
jgi:hypothetical protein